MQAYPGRNPVMDALRRKITPRQLRVMLEHLPADSPVSRELNGPWTDQHYLLWHIASELRNVQATTVNLFVPKGKPRVEPEYLPTPQSSQQEQEHSQEALQAEMDHFQMVLSRPNPH